MLLISKNNHLSQLFTSPKQLLLLLPALLILQACGSGDNGPRNGRMGPPGNNRDNRTSVETYEVEQKTIRKQVKSYGNVSAQDIVTISPQVNNRVTDIYVDLGDTVQQDQILAKIHDDTYRQQVRQNRSQLEQRKSVMLRDSIEFFRQKKLYEQDLISDAEFETAQSNYQSSKAQFQSAQSALEQSLENLNNTEVKSPVYGVVLSRNVAEGDVASSGQTMFELANLTGLETRVHLPMHEWEQVNIGQEVQLSSSNGPGYSAMGRVSRKSPRVDPTTGLGEVVISLTSRGPTIHQGALVEAAITVETREQVPVIPRGALIENVETFIEPESNSIELRRTYSVFVVEGDSVAKKRSVELGIDQGSQVEISNGLTGSEEIVITGQNNLTDGRKVKVVSPEQLEEPPSSLTSDSTLSKNRTSGSRSKRQ